LQVFFPHVVKTSFHSSWCMEIMFMISPQIIVTQSNQIIQKNRFKRMIRFANRTSLACPHVVCCVKHTGLLLSSKHDLIETQDLDCTLHFIRNNVSEQLLLQKQQILGITT